MLLSSFSEVSSGALHINSVAGGVKWAQDGHCWIYIVVIKVFNVSVANGNEKLNGQCNHSEAREYGNHCLDVFISDVNF